jgi:hypothetical protein
MQESIKPRPMTKRLLSAFGIIARTLLAIIIVIALIALSIWIIIWLLSLAGFTTVTR